MKTPLLAAASLACVTFAAVSPALAGGGYVGVSVSSGDDIGGPGFASSKIETRKQLHVGKKLGMLSIEANAGAFDATVTTAPLTGRTLGAAARLAVPISPAVYLFGTVGGEHAWLTSHIDGYPSWSGNELVYGGGLEMRLDFMASGSIWAGILMHDGSIGSDTLPGELDVSTTELAIGATVGF